MEIPRRLAPLIRESLDTFRAVVLHGPRQSGKTTLARSVAASTGGDYVSLDLALNRDAAAADPHTFVEQLAPPVVIDEIQRVGEPLVLAIKALVDEDPRPGRALLTGSTNFLTVPQISETLAGRVDIQTLWPFSESELRRTAGTFLDRLFTEPEGLTSVRTETPTRDSYLELVCRGGFPEAIGLAPRARRRWFDQYVQTVIDREIRAVADIRRAELLRDLARLFAARTSQVHVTQQVARTVGADRATIEVHRAWLQTVFLVRSVPAWSRNIASRVTHHSKLAMVDTGLAAALCGKDPAALRNVTDPMTGPLLETFVVNDLQKSLGWSDVPARLSHYRESSGVEVDIVLETPDGRVCALEVKSTVSPRPADASGIAALRRRLDRAGGTFVHGVVLHTGPRRFQFDDRVSALPIADIWQ